MLSPYKQRVADGLCGKCGEKRDGDGSLCSKCREAERQRAAAKRSRNSDTGICINCSKPAVDGKRCEQCKAAAKASRNRSVRRRKEEGICTACANPAKPGCSLCQPCIDARSKTSSEHYQRRKADGLCRFCNEPPAEPGGSMCAYHKEKYADYRLQTKLDAFEAYGGAFCCLCNEQDVTILEIDHIDGGGCKHRRELGLECGGYSFYLWLRRENYPAGFRVLCPTCNKQAHVKKYSGT